MKIIDDVLKMTKRLNRQGYVIISALSKRNRSIMYHRYVMLLFLGRRLERSLVVHHIDGNKLNNHISNLELCTRSCHSLFHMQNISDKTREKISVANKGKVRSKLTKALLSEISKNMSLLTKHKMSTAKKGKTLTDLHKINISKSLTGVKQNRSYITSNLHKQKLSVAAKNNWIKRKIKENNK